MRLTKYVKSDGENWMMVKLRCSAQAAYSRLDVLMLQSGWVHFSSLKEKFNRIKQRIARQDPIKYPDWKQVEIPMYKGKIGDLPELLQIENKNKTIQLEEEIATRTPEQKKDALSEFAKKLGVG